MCPSGLIQIITKTRLYNFDPLKPHFYTVKLGFIGVYNIFLISAQNIDCGYSLEPPRRGGSNEYQQSMFWADIWKISGFFIWKFSVFLGWNFAIYLNRHVLVMFTISMLRGSFCLEYLRTGSRQHCKYTYIYILFYYYFCFLLFSLKIVNIILKHSFVQKNMLWYPWKEVFWTIQTVTEKQSSIMRKSDFLAKVNSKNTDQPI